MGKLKERRLIIHHILCLHMPTRLIYGLVNAEKTYGLLSVLTDKYPKTSYELFTNFSFEISLLSVPYIVVGDSISGDC